MNRVSAAVAASSWSTASRSTTSKYTSNLDRSWPPIASPNSLDHGLQVHLWVQIDLALQVHLWVTRSWPPSASPNSPDHGLQVHLQTRSMTASKCISEFNSITGSKCISKLLDLGLQMHLQTPSITASKSISKLSPSRPPSTSPTSHDHVLQVHL